VSLELGKRSGLWRRVLITSSGWTARVVMVPAERPAIVSTSAGERRAWFSFICEIELLVFAWCYVSGDVMTMLKLAKNNISEFRR